jgi:hypothetical protein
VEHHNEFYGFQATHKVKIRQGLLYSQDCVVNPLLASVSSQAYFLLNRAKFHVGRSDRGHLSFASLYRNCARLQFAIFQLSSSTVEALG